MYAVICGSNGGPPRRLTARFFSAPGGEAKEGPGHACCNRELLDQQLASYVDRVDACPAPIFGRS
jgi:hypothetical protein